MSEVNIFNQKKDEGKLFSIFTPENYKDVNPPHFDEKKAISILENEELIDTLRNLRQSTRDNYLRNLVSLGNLVDSTNYQIDSADSFLYKQLNSNNNSYFQIRQKIISLNQAHVISLPELYYLLTPSCLEIQEIDGTITMPEGVNQKRLTQELTKKKIPCENIRQANLLGTIELHPSDLIQLKKNIFYSQTSNRDKKIYDTYERTMQLLELEHGLYFYVKRLNLLALWGATGLIYTDTSARPLQKITSLIWKQISDSPIPQQQFSNLYHESLDAKHFSEEIVQKAIKGWKKLGLKIGLIDERGSSQSTLKNLKTQLNKYLDEKPEIKKLGNAFFYLYIHPLFPQSVHSGYFAPEQPLSSRDYSTSENAKQQWTMAKKLVSLLTKDSMERCTVPIA
ncbi:MAG TPA: hypothetical protein VJB63_02315 [Patescibacteria group bacterium]|nr:hypothetical protein [Patescibacteria group bacterium]